MQVIVQAIAHCAEHSVTRWSCASFDTADVVEIKHILLPPSPRDYKDIFVVFELMETDLHQVPGMGQRVAASETQQEQGAGDPHSKHPQRMPGAQRARQRHEGYMLLAQCLRESCGSRLA